MGLETLHIRMREHSKNAFAVAKVSFGFLFSFFLFSFSLFDELSWLMEPPTKFLSKHPLVSWVNYPGLPDHDSHHLAKKYFQQDLSISLPLTPPSLPSSVYVEPFLFFFFSLFKDTEL